MKTLALALLAVLLWAAVFEGGIRQWEADDAHRAAVGACLARTHKTVAQCEDVP